MNVGAVKLALFLNYFVFAILLNSVGTVIFQVQNAYGVSESAASVLEAYKDLSIALTSFLIASFVAGFGYKRAMLSALGAVAVACLAMPQLPVFWMTKLLFAVTGISFAAVKVSVYASLTLVTRNPREHASTMNFLEAFFMVGVLSGYFIFSAFVDDADPAAPGWLNVYYLLAALAGAAMLLLARTRLDESAARAETATQETVGFAAMVILFRKPLIYTFIVCAFLYVLIEQSIMTWLPTFNSSVLNMSASLSIQMTSILAAATAAGRFSAGFLLRRVDWYLLLSACLLLAGTLVLVVLPLAESAGVTRVGRWADAPLAAFVFPLIGALLAPVYPAINSVVLSSLAPHQHAPMAGLIVLFSALGGTTGSILTGTLFELLGGRNAFYFSLLPIAAILITLWFFKQQTRRDDNAE